MNVSHVLDYRNNEVVRRYARRLGFSEAQAETHWTELMKFLSIAATDAGPLSPSVQIDELWHEFLADSVAYESFCRHVLGQVVHHVPSDKPEVELYAKTRREIRRQYGALDQELWPVGNSAASCHGKSCRSCTSCKSRSPEGEV